MPKRDLSVPATSTPAASCCCVVCGVEPRNPPRRFRLAWWVRQLSLVVDSMAMRQAVQSYILPIAGSKQTKSPDLTLECSSSIYVHNTW